MNVLWNPLFLSLKVAIISTIINTMLGVIIAFLLVQCRFRLLSNILGTILLLPLILPPTVIGYYLIILFGQNGFLGKFFSKFGINVIFTWYGALIASIVTSFPLLLTSARRAFENVDQNIEDAGRVLGLSEITLFLKITLPLASNGIIAGMLLSFARALGEFGATLMIAGNLSGYTQTISGAIYEAIYTGKTFEAGLLVVTISIICIVVLLIIEYKFLSRISHSSRRKR
ncbi:MAG: molybdate ABC transporter permease subunit [Bordetella sp.]|nr:MAG: molybdate ABC transporter permease subunit [Bordetella sp.]